MWLGKINQILCCDWLPTQGGWHYLACSGLLRLCLWENSVHIIILFWPFFDQACLVRWLDIGLVLFMHVKGPLTNSCTHPSCTFRIFTSAWARKWKELNYLQIRSHSRFFFSGEKWSLGADWLIAARTYPSFCSMKRSISPPLDGMLVHRRPLTHNLLGFPNNLLVPIYTPGWREALWQ